MRLVLHTTPCTYRQQLPTFPARSNLFGPTCAPHRLVPEKGVQQALLSTYARLAPSCCWTKIAPPVPICNSPSRDSCVMSTICQSPRACRDDFEQLLPSQMDLRRLFQSSWNDLSIHLNKVLARSHKQKRGNTNIQTSNAFIWLMNVAISPPRKTRGVSPIAIPSSAAMNALKY